MQLERELNPGDFVVLSSLLSKEGKRKKVLVVDKVSLIDIKDVEDRVSVNGQEESRGGRVQYAKGMVVVSRKEMLCHIYFSAGGCQLLRFQPCQVCQVVCSLLALCTCTCSPFSPSYSR